MMAQGTNTWLLLPALLSITTAWTAGRGGYERQRSI